MKYSDIRLVRVPTISTVSFDDLYLVSSSSLVSWILSSISGYTTTVPTQYGKVRIVSRFDRYEGSPMFTLSLSGFSKDRCPCWQPWSQMYYDPKTDEFLVKNSEKRLKEAMV